ncbi:MAG: EamA family transporter [Anaerolineales bacterium]|nr:EamA family transporter [Anaerolineales bacterium]MCS7247858.1 EamA family transporter [Anaerolineales bacterium]MDW8161668.1 EamA family transporter [Anaerolineales bacterium]MDW8446974.1 EamA family transporter [Anaerolineales bacterium]
MFGAGWLFYSVLSLLTWGLWGFFGKVASRSISGEGLVLVSNLGWLATYPILVIAFRNHLRSSLSSGDLSWGILAGAVGSLGMLFFYFALERGEASRVVAITAAYPLITALLAFLLLGENFSLQKLVGLVFALIGVVILSR